MKIAGILFIVFALVFLWLALLHFKNSLRFGLDEKNKGELITTGIFSLSRNPFFLSIDLYFTGAALIFSSFFFIGFAILVLVSIHFFILKEEKFMVEIYGRKYREYLRNVRRYF
jgi:protein-S-isoprenylcysteine O-methyltransferase Ste14